MDLFLAWHSCVASQLKGGRSISRTQVCMHSISRKSINPIVHSLGHSVQMNAERSFQLNNLYNLNNEQQKMLSKAIKRTLRNDILMCIFEPIIVVVCVPSFSMDSRIWNFECVYSLEAYLNNAFCELCTR